jgi:hypothetical protein
MCEKLLLSPLYLFAFFPTGQLAKSVNTFAVSAKTRQENHTFPEDLRTVTVTPRRDWS